MSLSPEEIERIKSVVKQAPPEQQEELLQNELSKLPPEELESLQKTQQCPFCLMVENKIPTTKVYEDEFCLAVLEINPANPGHTLLFPKSHSKSLDELSEQESEAIYKALNNLTIAISKIADGVNILTSIKPASGARFEHLIFNIIPRKKGDKIYFQWQPQKGENLEKIAKEIISHLPKKKKEKAKETPEEEFEKKLIKPKHRIPR